MRRYIAGALLLVLLGQSSGAALAKTPLKGQDVGLSGLIASVSSAVLSSRLYAQLTGTVDRYEAMHAPMPTRPGLVMTVNAAELIRSRKALRPHVREGVRQVVIMPDKSALDPHHRRLDPLAMRRSSLPKKSAEHDAMVIGNAAVLQPLHTLMSAPSPHGNHALAPPKQGTGINHTTSTGGGTGIEHWWTYEERAIPGIGKAMVNVGTGNYLVSAMDVDIPEQGIDLAFGRAYNSQSLHDANGDDGGDPSIFGNRWTNNLDASIIYDPNANTITVYDLDGSACTYTSNANGTWQPCAGEYATLAPTDGTDCTYAWTKTNGTVYWFHAEGGLGSGCSIPQAKKGQIQEIFARNQNNYITFAYSYDGSGKTSEDITEIDANHSDGDSLVMKFGPVPGTSINELSTITRPDGAVLQYLYDTSGNLVEVDKPGNNASVSIPHSPSTLPQGDAPESYAYASGSSTLQAACGPRCTAATWAEGQGSPTDGGAILFTANSSNQLTSWQFQGILNFTPTDQTHTVLQANPPTTWTIWYTATFAYSGIACGSNLVGATKMCDSDGHASIWSIDSSERVTAMQEATGNTGVSWLVTSQTWNANNELTSTTDANNQTTNYGYDDTNGYGGNMVEMQLPQAGDFLVGGQQISMAPLSYYSYDQNHNVTSYCDPVYNQKKGSNWVNGPGDNLCSGAIGTTVLAYATPAPEPYGCITNITKPGGYSTTISYASGSGPCGIGLPSKVQATNSIPQYDNSQRTPTQDLAYDGKGNLTNYDRGNNAGGKALDSWTLSYSPENQNTTRTENDSSIPLSGTAFTCRYPDGSVFYTETPSQHDADGDGGCPSVNALLNGNATAPAHAATYYYDLDADQIKIITHKACSSSTPCPTASTQTACLPSETNPIGTTCKYYDGLDRVVETIEPYDPRNLPNGAVAEFYGFRWMNRYIYDLSGNGGSANLHILDNTGTIQGIVAYGNLYKTQEYLPQSNSMIASSQGTYNTGSWSDVRGTSFDALDRPVGKYELAFGHSAPVTINTYDANGDLGNLVSVQNAVGQVTTYTHDHIERILATSFTGATPLADSRSYLYDPNGRTAAATGNNFGQISYTYDVDGNELSVDEPTVQSAASLMCYEYYPDGLREYLSIEMSTDSCSNLQTRSNPSNGGISQKRVFSYAYTQDNRLGNQLVTWGNVQNVFSWTYALSGRETSETDPLTGKSSYTPPNNDDASKVTFGATSYAYDQYGRVSQLTLPAGYAESSVTYDYDDELQSYNASKGGGTGVTRTFTLNARGELLEDSRPTATGYNYYQGPTQSANGAQVGNGSYQSLGGYVQAPPNVIQFDVRSNMLACGPNPSYPDPGSKVYTYDAAGRLVGTGIDPNGTECSASNAQMLTNTYDADNHMRGGQVQWGPDGHQYGDGSGASGRSAHWDGKSLLFATSGSTVLQLYIGKFGLMDQSGDLAVSDRDQTGAQADTHGYTTRPPTWMEGNYWYDGWSAGSARTINVQKGQQQYQYLLQMFPGNCNFTETVFPDQYVSCPTPGSSPGPVYPMIRTDGYTMYGGIVQGARTFSPDAGQWLSPDAYAGDVRDPMSQKPFMWNDNNPVEWSDPSGYCATALDCGLQILVQGASRAAGAIAGVATEGIGAIVMAGVPIRTAPGTLSRGERAQQIRGATFAAARGESEERENGTNPAADKRASKGEIQQIEKLTGESIEETKTGGSNAGGTIVVRDTLGNYYTKPASGEGPGEPLGINRSDLSKATSSSKP